MRSANHSQHVRWQGTKILLRRASCQRCKRSEGAANPSLAWTSDPTFQFRVLRTGTEEELFSTYGHVIVFEDQFLELATNMIDVRESLKQRCWNTTHPLGRTTMSTDWQRIFMTFIWETTIRRLSMQWMLVTPSMVMCTELFRSTKRHDITKTRKLHRTECTLAMVRKS